MAPDVRSPDRMNAAFAEAFNSRDIANLLQLYEPKAMLCATPNGAAQVGIDAIEKALQQLLKIPGRMLSHNRFCLVHDNLALLRADWRLAADDGAIVASGSSAELIRRQNDGRWLYVIDHAVGASLESLPTADALPQETETVCKPS
ncbi:MAG: nuclear transport factor 2 family protein [Acidovorax sp.]|nr:nuclear transport factor 2 family protein [Acidovorax sp.]